MKQIYLDNGASTMLDPKVVKAMLPYFTKHYANASSLHTMGLKAKEALENSRAIIAKSINAKPREIIFTSGGTESNNFALKALAFFMKKNNKEKNHIISTKIEHKSILKTLKWLETQGFKVSYLNVDSEGFIDLKELEEKITKKTFLVSIIHGNNEIGTIQDLKKIGNICKKYDVYFHSDACQSYTKTKIDVKKQNIDLLTLNAHKIHGPKGVGALYIKKGTNIKPWQHGGDHEFKLRAGTENIHGIVGFAEAVKLAKPKHIKHMTKLRDKLIKNLTKIKGVKLNGPRGEKRLCNNINLCFKGIEGEALSGYLDQKGICVSTRSACSSKSLEPSYVLKAIGLSNEEANSSIRLTLSRFNTEQEIDYVIKTIPSIVKKLRRISPFGKLIENVLKKNP